MSDVYKLVGILKANGSVTASKVSGEQPASQGGSYLLIEIFGGSGVHVRTAIGIPCLPDATPVELVISLSA